MSEVTWPGVADQGSSQARRAWTWCPWTLWEAAEAGEERMCPYCSLIGRVQRWWRGASQPSKHGGLPVWAERKVGPEHCLPEVQPGGRALGDESGEEGLLERHWARQESGAGFQAWLPVQIPAPNTGPSRQRVLNQYLLSKWMNEPMTE